MLSEPHSGFEPEFPVYKTGTSPEMFKRRNRLVSNQHLLFFRQMRRPLRHCTNSHGRKGSSRKKFLWSMSESNRNNLLAKQLTCHRPHPQSCKAWNRTMFSRVSDRRYNHSTTLQKIQVKGLEPSCNHYRFNCV